jgi:hypothetical protein
MPNHPGMEKLELLQQGKLRGAELLEVLRHLENCDECFFNLPPQDPTGVISRLLKNEEDEIDKVDEEKTEK